MEGPRGAVPPQEAGPRSGPAGSYPPAAAAAAAQGPDEPEQGQPADPAGADHCRAAAVPARPSLRGCRCHFHCNCARCDERPGAPRLTAWVGIGGRGGSASVVVRSLRLNRPQSTHGIHRSALLGAGRHHAAIINQLHHRQTYASSLTRSRLLLLLLRVTQGRSPSPLSHASRRPPRLRARVGCVGESAVG